MVEATIQYEGGLHCRAVHGPSQSSIETDAPADNMGRGERFSPTDLTATSLATCVLTTMAIMGTRIGVELAGSTAQVRKHMTSEPPRRIAKLEVEVNIPLSPQHPDRARLEAAANGCPVRRSLHPDVEVVETFAWTGEAGTGA
ncbi:MAG: OsmC family protein [Verrucomicrobiales bacterium]|nr:OsmC family protein [Verrucomicrobiales bacterium]